MKNCTKCKYAEWERTKTGALHPSGDGKCQYQYKVPQLPASMYWIGIDTPRPCGGQINRRKELKKHCPYYSQGEYNPKKPKTPAKGIPLP